MIDTREFVKRLKQMGVEYDKVNKKHWVGYNLIADDKNIITNVDMKLMCSNFFGREYDLLTNTQKTNVRMKVFKELREVQDE